MKQNIIILLLCLVILLQLASVKHSHDNSYRLSQIVKNTGSTSAALGVVIGDGIGIAD